MPLSVLTIKFRTADKKLIFQYESDLVSFLDDYGTTDQDQQINFKTKKNFFIKAFKRSRVTLLRSPHANKNTQESFERVTYTGQFQVFFDRFSETTATRLIRYFLQNPEQNLTMRFKSTQKFQV